jgi:hypothetical protein
MIMFTQLESYNDLRTVYICSDEDLVEDIESLVVYHTSCLSYLPINNIADIIVTDNTFTVEKIEEIIFGEANIVVLD